MSIVSILLEKVSALTERLNLIQSNAKKIDELPVQDTLVLTSKLHVSENGDSKSITVQDIVDAVAVSNSLFVGSYVSLSALTTAHPSPVTGSRAIITVDGDDDKIAYWDEGQDVWFTPTVTVEIPNYKQYILVTASRDLIPSDKGNVLVVQNSGVVLTAQTTLQSDFNCEIQTEVSADATIEGGSGVTFNNDNNLVVLENNIISIGRIDDEFIVSNITKKEHQIKGARSEANVSGAYDIDLSIASDFPLTMTANTTFTFTNLPTGTDVVRCKLRLTGEFTPTFSQSWLQVFGDDYDGTKWNSIIVDISNGNATLEKGELIFQQREDS